MCSNPEYGKQSKYRLTRWLIILRWLIVEKCVDQVSYSDWLENMDC